MFSPANSKLKKLYKVKQLRNWLKGKKVYSFDILSGHSCPYAHDCQSKAVETENGRRIQDGKDTQFRCFSASQEVIFTAVYNRRKANFESVKGKSSAEMAKVIQSALPEDAGIVRIHVAGDMFSQDYFDAWMTVARNNPSVLFYGYTKSLPYLVKRLDSVPSNVRMTASMGGRRDDLIAKHGLRYAKVVYHPSETELPIDHDDSHAAMGTESFALLVHGIQPAKSDAQVGISRMKKEGVSFSYRK